METTSLPARTSVPKFSKEKHYERFFTLLSYRVEESLAGQNQKGNAGTLIKAVVLILLYVFLVFLASFGPKDAFSLFAIAVLLGLLSPIIGFCVSHESVHGSLSANAAINAVLASSFELLGCSSFFWYWKHNIIHHTFTNVDTYDDDIDIPGIRTHPGQPWKPLHRYQHLYWWLWYLTTYFIWVYKMDFDKLNSRAIGKSPRKPIEMKPADMRLFWTGKVWHPVALLLLPTLMHGPIWILCYATLMCITGFMISIVFQIAHLVPQVKFSVVPPDGERFPYSFKVHQIVHTADFAPDNEWVLFWIGGLNCQVEHHLFPEIHSRHYPKIRKIVAATCAEWNESEPKERHVQYTCFPTTDVGFREHIRLLKLLGTKP